MKSITERKKEAEEIEKRKRMKRTKGSSSQYRRFNIPTYTLPWNPTLGDLEFLKKKANELLSICQTSAPNRFYRYLKEAILEQDRLVKEQQEKEAADRLARRRSV